MSTDPRLPHTTSPSRSTSRKATTMEPKFAISTSRDGSRRIHKLACKKQPRNSIPADSMEMFDSATPASCCKPKTEGYLWEMRVAQELRDKSKAKPATAPKRDEHSVTVTVAWTPNVAKLFFRALAKDGTRTIAEAAGVEHKSNEVHQRVELTGDPATVAALAERLPAWWDSCNEELREWRKTSPDYKAHNLQTKDGAKAAFLAEQDLLRQMCADVAPLVAKGEWA